MELRASQVRTYILMWVWLFLCERSVVIQVPCYSSSLCVALHRFQPLTLFQVGLDVQGVWDCDMVYRINRTWGSV